MGGFFQQFLKGATKGFRDGFLEKPYLRDYTHASKTFRTNAYGNSPKFKWNFHVYFDINSQLISAVNALPPAELPGILVKNIQLPKYSMSLAEMNQYNRKRWVQTKINYDPVSITFHDDNNNAIRQLWYTYYSYYYNDPTQPGSSRGTGGNTTGDAASILNKKNTYDKDIQNDQNWGYLGEPSNSNISQAIGITKAPFFKSIKIYGFNQHSFSLYELINPIIEKFDHDTYDYYSNNGIMENKMTIKYESVKYSQGAINGDAPGAVVPGFGSEANYDRTLSPIARPGANKTILGQGGLVDAGAGIIEDLSNGNILGAIQKGGTAARTFKNPQSILQAAKGELVAGAIGVAGNPQTIRSVFNFPANGAGTGAGSQQTGSNNQIPTGAPRIATPPNTPIRLG
jgi:hypothetical protein